MDFDRLPAIILFLAALAMIVGHALYQEVQHMSALYGSGRDQDNWVRQEHDFSKRIELGVIVAYKLPEKDRPTNPNKIWRGLVKSLYGRSVLVEMLEPGFVGLEERVEVENIVGVE